MNKSILDMSDQELAAAMERAKGFQRGAMLAFGISTALFIIGAIGTVWYILS